MPKVIDLKHPDYGAAVDKWSLWRNTFRGGSPFIDSYLERFSSREDPYDFSRRKRITYVPAFAKLEINNVKNAIYRRSNEIIRKGGSDTYQYALSGKRNGVDLLGSSLSYFIGQKIVPELLTMSKVGIYVDMPVIDGQLKGSEGAQHPYLYYYAIEDILNWVYDESDRPNQFSSILLRDYVYEYDPETNFPIQIVEQYRRLWINQDGYTEVQFYDKAGLKKGSSIQLDISTIPFIMPSLTYSLLEDVASYQIALLNLASSEIAYCLLANYPFYTEQYDERQVSPYLEGNNEPEIKIGLTQGRRYPLNTERPAFIHPSSEPLKASMEKEADLKDDIKRLVHSAISNLTNDGSVEAGLSHIGAILQDTENKIGEYWSLYEQVTPPTVIYPTDYTLGTPSSLREEVAQDIVLINTINSQTYRKEIAKEIVRKTLANKSSTQTILTINDEIDSAEVVVSDPDVIRKDIEAGIVSERLASIARGYPEGEVEQARLDHAERIRRIQVAQTPPDVGARGLDDLSADPEAAKREKQLSQSADLDGNRRRAVRGEAK